MKKEKKFYGSFGGCEGRGGGGAVEGRGEGGAVEGAQSDRT